MSGFSQVTSRWKHLKGKLKGGEVQQVGDQFTLYISYFIFYTFTLYCIFYTLYSILYILYFTPGHNAE